MAGPKWNWGKMVRLAREKSTTRWGRYLAAVKWAATCTRRHPVPLQILSGMPERCPSAAPLQPDPPPQQIEPLHHVLGARREERHGGPGDDDLPDLEHLEGILE